MDTPGGTVITANIKERIMKFNEFCGIDVMADMEQRIQESINERRPNLTEDIVADRKEVDVFAGMSLSQSIPEDDLIVGQYYYPVLFVPSLPNKLLNITITTKDAEFLGVVGSRLEFKFSNSGRSMFFPSDEVINSKKNWYRFVYDHKRHLDSFAVTLMMKFSNRDWILKTEAYTERGECNQITNLSFIPAISDE